MAHAHDLAHAAIRDDASAAVAELVRSGGSELAPGVPALCVAANYSSFRVVASLIEAGVDVMARYERQPFAGWTALHFACLATGAAAAATASALVAAGASTEARTSDGLLPIDVAGDATVKTALLAGGRRPRTPGQPRGSRALRGNECGLFFAHDERVVHAQGVVCRRSSFGERALEGHDALGRRLGADSSARRRLRRQSTVVHVLPSFRRRC